MPHALIHSAELDAFAQGLRTQAPLSVLCVMPSTQASQAEQALALAQRRMGASDLAQLGVSPEQVLLLGVLDDERLGLVALHNRVFRSLTCTWYGYLAQDAFAGRDWLSLALAALTPSGGARDPAIPARQMLGFNDGKWQGQIASFGLVRRDWAASLYGGDLFFAGYHSHFADTELTLIAREQQVYAYDPHAMMVEIDPDKDAKPVHAQDRSMFRTRVQTGFAGRVKRPDLLQLIR